MMQISQVQLPTKTVATMLESTTVLLIKKRSIARFKLERLSDLTATVGVVIRAERINAVRWRFKNMNAREFTRRSAWDQNTGLDSVDIL